MSKATLKYHWTHYWKTHILCSLYWFSSLRCWFGKYLYRCRAAAQRSARQWLFAGMERLLCQLTKEIYLCKPVSEQAGLLSLSIAPSLWRGCVRQLSLAVKTQWLRNFPGYSQWDINVTWGSILFSPFLLWFSFLGRNVSSEGLWLKLISLVLLTIKPTHLHPDSFSQGRPASLTRGTSPSGYTSVGYTSKTNS